MHNNKIISASMSRKNHEQLAKTLDAFLSVNPDSFMETREIYLSSNHEGLVLSSTDLAIKGFTRRITIHWNFFDDITHHEDLDGHVGFGMGVKSLFKFASKNSIFNDATITLTKGNNGKFTITKTARRSRVSMNYELEGFTFDKDDRDIVDEPVPEFKLKPTTDSFIFVDEDDIKEMYAFITKGTSGFDRDARVGFITRKLKRPVSNEDWALVVAARDESDHFVSSVLIPRRSKKPRDLTRIALRKINVTDDKPIACQLKKRVLVHFFKHVIKMGTKDMLIFPSNPYLVFEARGPFFTAQFGFNVESKIW